MVRPLRPRLPKNIEELAEWYTRYISPIALISGVVFDNLVLLRRVDLWTSNALLAFYLVLAAFCIIILNLIETGRLRQAWLIKLIPIILIAAQFAFGGLFSAFVSLYSRSAAVATSWIFVLLVAALLIGNERFARLYMRIEFQVSMFFMVLFSFLIFFLPVVVKQIGPYMFLLSGAVSLLIISAFYALLLRLVPERALGERTRIARSIAIIFIVFNVLYFTGAIPPLPLALKEAGVYHSIARDGDNYRLLGEPLAWYQAFFRYNTLYHEAPTESAHVFTAVFAPSGLTTTVYHEWQYYDPDLKQWVTTETVPFYIVGGRDGGYRGYSVKREPAAGSWRVNVTTAYGQLIGRVSFTVVATSTPVPLQEITS